VEYRLTTNTAILWNTGHTKVKSCMGRVELKKKKKNLNMDDIFSLQGWI
jgi:hypothetical protein